VLTLGQPNILVDNSGRARIADFGLATVTQNLDSMQSASRQHGHSVRWAAPEILSEKGAHSKEADVFAFSMVMIEVGCSIGCRISAYCHFVLIQAFTGAIPFSSCTPPMAMLAIMQGKRPPRPTHPALTEELWEVMQHCWATEPNLRPPVSDALKILFSPLVSHSWWRLCIH